MSSESNNPKGKNRLQLGKRVKREMRKRKGQVEWLTKVPLGTVYTLRERDPETKEIIPGSARARLDVKRGVALPGMAKAVLGVEIDENGNKRFPVPVIHLRNEQDPSPGSESEHRAEIGMDVLQAIWENRWLTLNGKHMLPFEVVEVLSKALPNAADFAAYGRRFCAPLIGNGLHSGYEFIVKDILSMNKDGQVIWAGSDGNASAHPDHAIFIRVFGVDGPRYPIQATGWHPTLGVFFKGIIIPDPRCIDENGRPTLWLDYSLIKGTHKAFAKAMSGNHRGAFDENGVLVNPDKLMEFKRGEGFYIGILQCWEKPSYMASCFENLQIWQDGKENREMLVEKVSENLHSMTIGGGMKGILLRIAEDKMPIRIAVSICDAVATEEFPNGVDPLTIPYLKSLVDDECARWKYQLAQGGGIKYDAYTAVLDNGIEPGRCIIAPYTDADGVEHYAHNSEVAVTRVPITLPQAALVLKNVDPRKKGWEHLSHYSYWINSSAGKSEIVQGRIIVMNSKDLTDKCAGDADGDQMECSDDPRIIAAHRTKISIGPFNEDAVFLIEGGRIENSWKTKVKSWDSETQSVPQEAVRIIGMDGQGPVGLVSMYQAAFWALGMTMEALAMAVLIQRAIDAAKHVMLPADPFKLRNPGNWYETEEGSNVWEPRDCDADPNDKEWPWADKNGLLNIGTLVKWFSYVTNGAKLGDILTWRPDNSSEKKLNPNSWNLQSSPRGENLVHFNNAIAHHLYHVWEQENIEAPKTRVDLVKVLGAALGREMPDPLDPTSVDYMKLSVASGLTQFHRALHKIIEQKLEADERGPLIDAEVDVLHLNLQKLMSDTSEAGLDPIDLLLVIWTTELSDLSNLDGRDRDKRVNRAFRAISFPGSPILEALGIEVQKPCSYMRDHVVEVVEYLKDLSQEKLEDGGAMDIFHAVACWPEIDAEMHDHADRHVHQGRHFTNTHEAVTGISAKDCKDCKRMLTSKVVNAVRNVKENLEPQFTKTIGSIVYDVNQYIKNNKTGGNQ